jgi:hypothetical protein
MKKINSFAEFFNGFSISSPRPGHLILDLDAVLLKYNSGKEFFDFINRRIENIIKDEIQSDKNQISARKEILKNRIIQCNKLIKKYKKLCFDLTNNLPD